MKKKKPICRLCRSRDVQEKIDLEKYIATRESKDFM